MTKLKFLGYLLVVLFTIGLIIYVVITKAWPEYEASLGSSERLFSIKNYNTGVEVKVTAGPEFFLIINKEGKLSNIFLENEKAITIANKDIENKKIEIAIPEIFQNLIDNKLVENEIIEIIIYNEEEMGQKVINLARQTLEQNNKTAIIQEKNSTLQQKAEEEKIEEKEDSSILWSLYLVSVEIIDHTDVTEKIEKIDLTEEQAATYADNIYQKLNTYRINASVTNQARNDTTMPIQLIPGDSSNSIYSSSDSWYYIENSQIYAEITIESNDRNYTFCYQGSIENKKEGMCQ